VIQKWENNPTPIVHLTKLNFHFKKQKRVWLIQGGSEDNTRSQFGSEDNTQSIWPRESHVIYRAKNESYRVLSSDPPGRSLCTKENWKLCSYHYYATLAISVHDSSPSLQMIQNLSVRNIIKIMCTVLQQVLTQSLGPRRGHLQILSLSEGSPLPRFRTLTDWWTSHIKNIIFDNSLTCKMHQSFFLWASILHALYVHTMLFWKISHVVFREECSLKPWFSPSRCL